MISRDFISEQQHNKNTIYILRNSDIVVKGKEHIYMISKTV